MAKRMILMVFVVAVVFGAIFGYKAFMGKMMAKFMFSGKAPTVTVSAAKPESLAWQQRLSSVGSLRAANGITLTTEASGIVEEINFKSGDQVKTGQVLLKLNADAETAQLHSLKILAQLSHTVYERDKKQFAVQAISRAVLDGDCADVANKLAMIKQQEAIIAKKVIRAPFDGKIGISLVSIGQYLNPGSKVAALQALDRMYVDFYLPQQDIAKLAVGQAVELATDAYPGKVFNAKIAAIDSLVEVDTRNIQVEAAIDNTKHELLPGMYAAVEVLAGAAQDYLTLPQTAITFNPYGETVFVLDENGEEENGKPVLIAKQKFVVVGQTRGDQIAALKGLREDDLVVTSGQLKLKNGSKVIVNNQVQPSNDANPEPVDQ